ncbi:hypothetical protein F5X96DRAFT_633097 [Biscogniauxia mediterranea]|nr:hypothetical protein F5X96DRAFT_633097 [Biscogniauxia mediterranea]
MGVHYHLLLCLLLQSFHRYLDPRGSVFFAAPLFGLVRLLRPSRPSRQSASTSPTKAVQINSSKTLPEDCEM